jgi:hypothetical protein
VFFERNDCTLKLFRSAAKALALQGRSQAHSLLSDKNIVFVQALFNKMFDN